MTQPANVSVPSITINNCFNSLFFEFLDFCFKLRKIFFVGYKQFVQNNGINRFLSISHYKNYIDVLPKTHSSLQLFHKQTADCVQHSKDHNTYKLLGFTQSTVSHQLNLLKANKMIRRYKDGKKVFYPIAIPISALESTGASLIPSPTNASFALPGEKLTGLVYRIYRKSAETV